MYGDGGPAASDEWERLVDLVPPLLESLFQPRMFFESSQPFGVCSRDAVGDIPKYVSHGPRVPPGWLSFEPRNDAFDVSFIIEDHLGVRGAGEGERPGARAGGDGCETHQVEVDDTRAWFQPEATKVLCPSAIEGRGLDDVDRRP